MSRWRCRRPGVTLDNIVVIPGTLLPSKARYQAIANTLPQGDILIVLPAPTSREYGTMTRVKALVEAKGHRVTTVPADHVGA